jgi:hypothetical protein
LIYALSPQIELTTSGGLQYQEPDYAQLAADPKNHTLKAKRVATGVVGVEYSLKKFTSRFIVEGFYKRFDRAPLRYDLTTEDKYDKSNRYISKGEGYSYGVELFAHKKLVNHFFGTLAYSLSRSWQYDIRPGHDGELLPGDFDFRNILTVTGGYKLDLIEIEWYKKIHNKWWVKVCSPILPIADRIEISAKFRYLGGRPYTEKDYDESRKQWIDRDDDYMGERYPDYQRLDIRFERRYGFGFLQMIYYFDIQNVYSQLNIWTYMYSDRRGTRTPINQFPIFPAGGVIIGF